MAAANSTNRLAKVKSEMARKRENHKLSKMSKSESQIINQKKCLGRGGRIIERKIGDSHLIKPITESSDGSSSTLKVYCQSNVKYDNNKRKSARENVIDGNVSYFLGYNHS